MKSRELMAACLNPGADTYMYRRVLRELVAKTDYATCIIQSGRTYYEWNRNLRPTLYDLTLRLEGGMHEVTASGHTRTATSCNPYTRRTGSTNR